MPVVPAKANIRDRAAAAYRAMVTYLTCIDDSYALAMVFAGNDFSQKIAGATFADNDVRSRTVSVLDRRSLRQNSAQLPTIKVDL